MENNDVMQIMTIRVSVDRPFDPYYVGTFFAHNFDKRYFRDRYIRIYWVVNDFPIDLWKALVEKYRYSIEELAERCKVEYLEYKKNKKYVQFCKKIEENR